MSRKSVHLSRKAMEYERLAENGTGTDKLGQSGVLRVSLPENVQKVKLYSEEGVCFKEGRGTGVTHLAFCRTKRLRPGIRDRDRHCFLLPPLVLHRYWDVPAPPLQELPLLRACYKLWSTHNGAVVAHLVRPLTAATCFVGVDVVCCDPVGEGVGDRKDVNVLPGMGVFVLALHVRLPAIDVKSLRELLADGAGGPGLLMVSCEDVRFGRGRGHHLDMPVRWGPVAGMRAPIGRVDVLQK
jgi:hypothetical protein